MKKKICVAIANRTNYSKLRLVLAELKKYDDVDIEKVASSSILLDKYGSAYKDMENDGFPVDVKIDCLLMNDTHGAMATTVGLSMIQHAQYMAGHKPDMLLVVGDRFDALPSALAAAMMNIPIAHIQGGEITGTIDDKVRDLISKLSTLHFVATESNHDRLVKWGIESAHIFVYGCPAIEYVSNIDVGNKFDPDKLKKKFKRAIEIGPEEDYVLVMIHPDTTNEHDISTETVLKAVESFGMKAFVFYPNVDANNAGILMDIEKFKRNEKFYMIRHMPLEGFIHTMAHACCMVGNSSAGIREAATFGVPVINIGDRQKGRERNHNVTDVRCDYSELINAIKSVKDNKFEKKNLYYKKDCSKNIAREIVNFLNRQ